MSADTLNSKRQLATVLLAVAVFASRIAAEGLGDDPASTIAPGPVASTPSSNSSSGLVCYKCEGGVNSTCGLLFDSSKVNKTSEADGFHSCFMTFKGQYVSHIGRNFIKDFQFIFLV